MTDPATAPTLATDLDYQHVVDARFMDLAAREDLAHVKGYTWTTAPTELDALGLELIASADYEFAGQREALVRVGDCLAHVMLGDDAITARVAAPAYEGLARAEAALREILPPRTRRSRRHAATIRFWSEGGAYEGPGMQPRELDTVRWADVAANYPEPTRAALARLATGFRPGEGGKLVLWHGPPGTGKTYAIRALAWEWRRWCDVHYVTDPEALLGRNPAYLAAVLGTRRRPGPGPMPAAFTRGAGNARAGARRPARRAPRWRLVVLEDSGELLGPDARREVGQGLSRLLNSVDGLLGQGARALVLITTNEELGTLHRAVVRPGRCAARIAFETFDAAEAATWLAAHDASGPAATGASLADLYARAQAWAGAAEAKDAGDGAVGFAAALDLEVPF